jgi:hypothetical protein
MPTKAIIVLKNRFADDKPILTQHNQIESKPNSPQLVEQDRLLLHMNTRLIGLTRLINYYPRVIVFYVDDGLERLIGGVSFQRSRSRNARSEFVNFHLSRDMVYFLCSDFPLDCNLWSNQSLISLCFLAADSVFHELYRKSRAIGTSRFHHLTLYTSIKMAAQSCGEEDSFLSRFERWRWWLLGAERLLSTLFCNWPI